MFNAVSLPFICLPPQQQPQQQSQQPHLAGNVGSEGGELAELTTAEISLDLQNLIEEASFDFAAAAVAAASQANPHQTQGESYTNLPLLLNFYPFNCKITCQFPGPMTGNVFLRLLWPLGRYMLH